MEPGGGGSRRSGLTPRPALAVCAILLLTACGQDDRASLSRRAGGTPSPVPPPVSRSTAPPVEPARPPTSAPTSAAPTSPSSPPAPPASRPADPPRRDPDQRYEVTTTVLESPEHGPELCVGGVADSLPPQCGGVPVEPFSWDRIEGEESRNGTTWGTARFVGTFDGRVFHLTEPPSRPRPPSPSGRATFPTACAEPAGGWVVDPDRTDDDDRGAVIGYANAQRDVAAVWLSYPGGMPDDGEAPGESVLNLAFTGDLDRHRREARALWGGGLCVTRLARTRAALSRVQDELDAARRAAERAGVHVYGSWVDEVGNVVRASVLVADAVSRQWVDERFGPGWVELEGIFRPVR